MPTDTIEAIWKHKLAPNSFHMNAYPEFEYDATRGRFSLGVNPSAAEIQRAIATIKDGVRSYNQSIASADPGFRHQVTQTIAAVIYGTAFPVAPGLSTGCAVTAMRSSTSTSRA